MAGIDIENPVAKIKKGRRIEKCIEEMIEAENYRAGCEFKMQGLLYVFISELIENNNCGSIKVSSADTGEFYVYRAIQYMSKNYSLNISVSLIAKYLNLDRSYFSHILKKKLNKSPYQYLLDIRMDKACELLVLTKLSI